MYNLICQTLRVPTTGYFILNFSIHSFRTSYSSFSRGAKEFKSAGFKLIFAKFTEQSFPVNM